MTYKGSVISAQERELLLVRAQTGDEEALNLLFESCCKSLYCQAFRILAQPQDAEDAVQEAMLAAFQHLHRFQRRADFLTWATRIVINAARQHIRRARSRPALAWDHVEGELDGVALSERVRDPRPTPEEDVQRIEQREMLDHVLRKLPLETQQAIQLCKFSSYSLKEAATVLGVPASAVKARLHRGKCALSVSLKREKKIRFKPAAGKRSLLGPDSDENFCVA